MSQWTVSRWKCAEFCWSLPLFQCPPFENCNRSHCKHANSTVKQHTQSLPIMEKVRTVHDKWKCETSR